MRGRQITQILAAALALLMLVGCGEDGGSTSDVSADEADDTADASAEDPDDTDTDGDPSDDADTAEGGEDLTLRFGHLYETSHPFHRCGAEPFAEAVADAGIEVEIFPQGQLGGEQELVQSVESGDLDISGAGPGAVANWHGPWSVLDAAYAVDDWEHMRAVYESDIGDQLREGMMEDAGVHVADLWLYGSRHVTSNNEVRTPDDLAGVKLRAIDTPMSLANARAMGAEPVPVAFDELYLALQQGVVDGQENPIPP